MKKLLAFFALVVLTLGTAFAQIQNVTITGVVIDNNGNPLPGAEVIATGGGASTMTDADGSFSLSISPYLKSFTVYYVGLGSKTQKINGGSFFVVTMKEGEKQSAVFLNVFSGFQTGDDVPFGLMVGKLSKWGFYGKAYYGVGEGNYSVIAGAIKSLYKRNSFLYFGLGLASVQEDDYNGSIGYYTDVYPSFGIDFGYILRIKHFDMSVGCTTAFDFEHGTPNFIFQVGLGYVF